MCDYDYTESDRLRARIREHPADQVPVIEIGELVRILES
jgi:hypothetical protein